eukprot:Protomagalhaensia_wolfi_Nauph_80__4309@NODE_43_length_4308_cov_97_382759_g35_i0_p2_GENE_NODE_43_length_4308_cov_97_382759_g35_i0NODE_43_length_4308_cov_97_382759_g35_i0_p2_ORF_typecomplete_len416_score61_36DUF676/PF05057_14/3_3e30PGAP1/PF07819_13/2_8e09Abhydrolase_6/PF12697_7/1_4e08Palm_thioest/PF02089_15/7e08DLH/PF01738_18/1_4e05Lipase_2/PF01674_18/2e05DUF915/PF06028_11/20DUF915/PF06028_11/0_0077Hydrolase_4/PF12146_8/0_00087Hydrolase_4/PF12146_8/2e02Abhydrolase_1/PF00561_20/0_00017Peptidase_S9/
MCDLFHCSKDSLEPTGHAPSEGLHLLVFVHGLWGNPSHFKQMAALISAESPNLRLLGSASSAGGWSHDGADIAGERVLAEVEAEIRRLEKTEGVEVTKISLVGWSWGGLVARYVVGLLYATDRFVKLCPVNFTTFATPHLGLRSARKSPYHTAYHLGGAAALSRSGHQLFLYDHFRNTGRCLLDIMADPQSIFMKGLACFHHRSLYANIKNDRASPWFTSYVTNVDPFAHLKTVVLHEEPGYGGTILLADPPATPADTKIPVPNYGRQLKRGPKYLYRMALAPLVAAVYTTNAVVQNYASVRRVRRHKEDSMVLDWLTAEPERKQSSSTAASTHLDSDRDEVENDAFPETPFKYIKLTASQMKMIQGFHTVAWDKHPVHIRTDPHSHAIMIIKEDQRKFAEGHIVCRHWIDHFIF